MKYNTCKIHSAIHIQKKKSINVSYFIIDNFESENNLTGNIDIDLVNRRGEPSEHMQ